MTEHYFLAKHKQRSFPDVLYKFLTDGEVVSLPTMPRWFYGITRTAFIKFGGELEIRVIDQRKASCY